MKRVQVHPPTELDQTLINLRDFVESDPILKPLSEDMFSEVPNIAPYNKDPEGHRELKSFKHMLHAFNLLLTEGPQWNDIANKVGLIGCPFNAILDWPMATASGYMFFLYPEVNALLGAMLKRWEDFLTSNDSIDVLKPPNGWFGKGLVPLMTMGNMDGLKPATDFTFPQLYRCPDPLNTLTYGFQSWDQFFTRSFNDGQRPIEGLNDDSIIIHACESAPLQYPVSNV